MRTGPGLLDGRRGARRRRHGPCAADRARGRSGALEAFHEGLSPDTVHARFFSFKPTLTRAEVEHFTHVDHHTRVALVAELGDRLVGVARHERTADTREAEVAFVVADEHRGRGIGTVLLKHLAAGRLRA